MIAAAGQLSRLYLLDALRGVAAVLVVLYHLGQRSGGAGPLVPGGYLAVDFFFLLSGLVIASAYEERLRAGLGWRGFMRERLMRLYPMYLLGLVLGLVGWASGWAPEPIGSGRGRDVALAVGPNLLMGPSFSSGHLFPFNLAAWSLFFELAVNLLYVPFARRGSDGLLVGGVAASAGCLIVLALFSHGLDRGSGWSTIGGGLARAVFAFGLGVLFCRRGIGRRRMGGVWRVVLPLVMLPLLLMVPASGFARNLVDLAAMLVVFPASIVIAASAEMPAWATTPCEWLGRLSYPLYAVHLPVLTAVLFLAPDMLALAGIGVASATGAATALDVQLQAVARLFRARRRVPAMA